MQFIRTKFAEIPWRTLFVGGTGRCYIGMDLYDESYYCGRGKEDSCTIFFTKGCGNYLSNKDAKNIRYMLDKCVGSNEEKIKYIAVKYPTVKDYLSKKQIEILLFDSMDK